MIKIGDIRVEGEVSWRIVWIHWENGKPQLSRVRVGSLADKVHEQEESK